MRVDRRQVFKLGLLFSLWILLPLILLLVVQQQVATPSNPDIPMFRQQALWGVLFALLALAISLALAFSIARQKSLTNALEQAVNNLPMQFAYIDSERCYRFNNRTLLEAGANPAPDFYGRSVREVVGEAVYLQIEPYLDRALSGERMDFELRLPDGNRISDLAVSYLPDVAEGGQIKGLFVLADDITARKQAERRDKEQLLEFAHLSRLASVGEVAAEIAHQINQPLAAIAMFSNAAERTLASGGDLAQVRSWLETINGQSKRASDVIGSLRRFVRSDKMDSVALDLNTPLREVAALLSHNAVSRQVSFILELGDALPAVMANGILIEQVVFNLARNAIRSAAVQSPPGRVTIRSFADAERVWVEVLGNGPAPLTQPGEADNSPDVALSPGSELGFSLAICHSIIAGFEGEVGCRDDQCGGTFCYFNLPRCET